MNAKTKKIIFTTSWDDGNKLDLKLLKLLNQYNIRGTFYIPVKCIHKSLTNKDIKRISETQEIGAHSVNHLSLTEIPLNKAKKEIMDSKIYLENIICRKVEMFSYPNGKFNSEIKQIVKEAEFLGARTTQELYTGLPYDVFQILTTIHIYPFPLRKKDKFHYHLSRYLFSPLYKKFKKILQLKLSPFAFTSWFALAKALLDYVCEHNGVFHIWGHSWEIERFGMWNDLEKLFQYARKKKNIIYVTNGQLVKQTISKNSNLYQ